MAELEIKATPAGTLVEDLGCPHCGQVCDVCWTYDEEVASLRQRLVEAAEALRAAQRYMERGSRISEDTVTRAQIDGALAALALPSSDLANSPKETS